jgi:hypothetical protein
LISYCQTSKEASKVCQDSSFWRLKYKQDFGQDPEEDKIAAYLGLDERQSYIRKYTYMGGLTYGSEMLLTIDKILEPAILRGDRRLINYYMEYLRKLDKVTPARINLMNWFQVIKAALEMGYVDLAEELEKLYSKYQI